MSKNMYNDVKTWNPYVGCKFNCVYCVPSFQRMLHRVWACQGKKCDGCRDFSPHEHPERLAKLPSANTLWPCAHGDISFADPDFIRTVISTVNQGHHKKIYFQSKDPKCFLQYIGDFDPKRTVLLTTLETNRDNGYDLISSAPVPSARAIAFEKLPWPRKIITIEPVIDFDPEIFMQWIVNIRPEAVWVGYNSKNKNLIEPTNNKLFAFIHKLEVHGFEVRRKTIRPS